MGPQQIKLGSPWRFISVTLALFTLFRIIFYFVFQQDALQLNWHDTLHSFLLGLRFDFRISLILILPLFFWRLAHNFFKDSQKSSRSLSIFYTLILTLVLLIYAGDFGYYAYLQSRINFRIFEFAENLLISLQMILETYNVFLWGMALLSLSAALYFVFSRWVFVAIPYHPQTSRMKRNLKNALLLLVFIVGIHGTLSQYPLRWSDAFFTQNSFLAQLAMNPIHYLFDTSKNSKRDYDISQVKKYYDTVSKYLGVENPDLQTLNFKREVLATPKESLDGIVLLENKPNIVLIVMESMAAYKTGAFGNPAGASPILDRIASEGWLFENYYVPTEGTARSLFCILSGVPDLNAKSTSSRNPLIVDQNTPINAFTDYKKYYFIGGSAAWGNIRGIYMNNVSGLEMFEEDKLEGPRTDVWGLSDLDLFKESARVLKERSTQTPNSPFFAIIQTAGFHRPYTIPENHDDFQTIQLDSASLKKYGFNSNEELNSFRFSDYSLGRFLESVEKEPYFDNTIFIVQGDHGLPHDGAAHLSNGYKQFNLNRFHTPLVFYSKRIQTPKRIQTIITEPDLWPTVLGMLQLPFTNTGLGRNVLAPMHSQNSFAFSYVYYSDPLQIMLYDDRYLVYGTENGIESLHDYNSETPELDVQNQFAEKYSYMSTLLQGLFETSRYMLYHNKKMNR